MSTQSHYSSDVFRTLLLWAGILVLCFTLFGSIVVPVQAVGGNGWIEVRTDVPEGFDKHVIVCVINQDTGEQYATRLMAVNGYVSQFNLPAGKYVFEAAFLENSDFRYNTNMVNDAFTFSVSANENTSATLEFETIFNEDFATGAALVPPTEETEPIETTEATTPSEPSGFLGNIFGSWKGNDSKTDGDKETTEPSSTVTVTSPSGDPVRATVPGSETEPSTSGTEPTVPTVETEAEDESDSFTFVSSEEETEPSDNTEETEGEDVSEEESGLTFWQKALYAFIALAVFTVVILIFAYFYRRHWEEN